MPTRWASRLWVSYSGEDLRMAAKEHVHGGDPELEFQRLGLAPREVLDFSVNVSPLGVPLEVQSIWNQLCREVSRYPSVDGRGIVRYYQERFGLDPEQVLAGNGSTELIYLAPRALALEKVAVISPSFHDYSRASHAAGARLAALDLRAENCFAPPQAAALEEALAGADGLFLGNPNNPTGTVFPRKLLLDLAAAFPNKWLLVDEAFVQFLDQPESVTLITQQTPAPNILVFHSLTKFFALPGLRLGAAVGHPDAIARFRPIKEPWSVNRIAEKVALQLIGCADYERRLTQLISGERPRVFDQLRILAGIEPFPPSANFVLCRWVWTSELNNLLHCLLGAGVYVRDCRNFPGLEDNFFRMAIRGPEENDRLLSLLRTCIARCQ